MSSRSSRPKSVARGLQRVGRAGHELGAVSKGRFFPKFRADLLESAVVAKRMLEGAIEETSIPRNPLDVLAQQIVAICAEEEISVDDLHELVRRAYPFADLSRVQLENVLDMLAGRYPSDEFAELRPRIVWDRTGGLVRAREGAQRLAVQNAGTIPDRGLFGVHLVDGSGRVGELDEEMVYEARAGQVILLGASSWRIEEITRDRVLVSPAPGVPGAVPFWKGEGVGRPYELGEAIGQTSRELVSLSDERATERLIDEHRLDRRAAANLVTFLREQEAATRVVPSDRAIVIERFRDEIGDWRVCVLTPFGARVHAPWGLALTARLRDSLGLEVQSIWSDDGIALHLPDADTSPPLDDLMLEPDEVEDLVMTELGGSALFGARFRENAGARPAHPAPPTGRAHAALAAASESAEPTPGRPALRLLSGCPRDLPGVPAGRLRPAGAEADPARAEDARARPRRRRDAVRVARTPPHCSSTTSRPTCTRTTRRRPSGARRRSRSTATCSASYWARKSCATCSTPMPSTRSSGSCRAGRGTRTSCTTGSGVSGTSAVTSTSPTRPRRCCASGGRSRCGSAATSVLVAAEDAGRYRDALGAMPPGGVPAAFLEKTDEPLPSLLLRYARSRGPFTTAEAAERFGLEPQAAEAELAALERADKLVRGELRPGGTEREWCDPDVLRRLRRASLAALRREVEPTEQAAFGRFLPGWQGVDRRATLREALVPLQALPLPVSLWESELLPRRVPGLPAGAARPAVRFGRGRLGGRGPRPRRDLLPRRRAGARAGRLGRAP